MAKIMSSSSASPTAEVVMKLLANLTAATVIEGDGSDSNVTDYYDEQSSVPCDGPTPEQIQLYVWVSWWLEGVAQIALGCLGFVANAVAIPILLSKEMSSIFNRLLTMMAVFDNIFIVCSVLEAVRKHIVNSAIQEYLFGYFLYQFHNMILCCCIYITVALALERYKAVWHPVEYHQIISAGQPWRRVFYCIFPVVVFAVVFNLPKFFEVTFKTVLVDQIPEYDEDEGTFTVVNVTKRQLSPTWLRLDDNYVLWYSNIARLVVTGLIPFASLVFLNSRIYTVIRRRRRMTNRPRSAPSAAQKAEEAKQAIVLFVIVVLFLICHTLRIILNIHGLLNLKIVRESLQNGCSLTSHWALIGTSVSHILLTVNSSVNFVIYCFCCTTFRGILYRNVNRMARLCGFSKLLPDVHSEDGGGGGENNNNNNGVRRRSSPATAAAANQTTATTAVMVAVSNNGGGNSSVTRHQRASNGEVATVTTATTSPNGEKVRNGGVTAEEKKSLIVSEGRAAVLIQQQDEKREETDQKDSSSSPSKDGKRFSETDV